MLVLTMNRRRILASMLVALSVALPRIASAATWPDLSKVIRVAFPSDITGLDPAATQDVYSYAVQNSIFDALYVWDYLERPYRIVPGVALGMPAISADGRTWTIHIRQGIFFADDPAFGGQKRELTAADFVYSWKRVVDPRVSSPNTGLLERKLVGLDAAIAKAKASGRFDYDVEIPGLRTIDRHTLQLQLVEPDYTLLATLNDSSLRAVAREVIEKYADGGGRAMDHPVGTGPYRLKEWQRGRRVLLDANPGFRDERFPIPAASADAAVKSTAIAMQGKRLPQIGTVDIAIVEESNPRLLMFNAGELDLIDVPSDLVPRMIGGNGRLLPEYGDRGIQLQRGTDLATTFAYFNMEDPVVGGYSLDHIALRRAICSAYDVAADIRVIRHGQAMPSTQPLPPDVPGHVRGYGGFASYDPATARALLDKFGYRDRNGDGIRELPDGKPLLIRMASTPSAVSRQQDELWQRSLHEIGIKTEFQVKKFPEQAKAAHAGQLQFWAVAWNGDTADDYMRLFYGPNAGGANLARFRNAEFDALFLQSRRVPEGAERDKLYERMTAILAAITPWCPIAYRIGNTVAAPSIRGYRKNAHYLIVPWKYLDIDSAGRSPQRP